MKNSTPLLDQVAQKIAQSQNSLTTAAGPHKPNTKAELSAEEKNKLIDTINQAFELLRLNYHHLYFSAYSEIDALNSAKRLWFESLAPYQPEVVLKAVHELIKQSDYLPTISRIIRLCTQMSSEHTLPDTRSAYVEACQAPSPKRDAPWSHPAVYYAGQKSDWFFLANNTEKVALPVFSSHYEALCRQVLNGETLPAITPLALPTQETQALTKEENIQRMQKMRAELGI